MSFDEWLISRLRYHGVYSGAVDGAHGRSVIAAIEKFQETQGLKVTGVADDATVAALRVDSRSGENRLVQYASVSSPGMPREPVWLREARRYMGLKEIAGPKSNATIMGWAKRFGGWIANYFTNDDIPWCGLFVGHLISLTLPREKLPANPLGALQWAKFGNELSVPALGAILVFSRAGGGHVGFYLGETATHYTVLGGNQLNSVSITQIARSRLVVGGIRWPATGERPALGRIAASGTASISTSEA